MTHTTIVIGLIGLLILLSNAMEEEKKQKILEKKVDVMKGIMTDLKALSDDDDPGNKTDDEKSIKELIKGFVDFQNNEIKKSEASLSLKDVEAFMINFSPFIRQLLDKKMSSGMKEKLEKMVEKSKKINAPDSPGEKSWFKRSWKWLVLVVVIGISGFCIYYFQSVDNEPQIADKNEIDDPVGANIV